MAVVAWDCADDEYRQRAYNGMATEIERLRAEVRRLLTAPPLVEQLSQENERLRAALFEPTPEMLDAAEQYNREHIVGDWSFRDLYVAMTRASS